MLLELLGLLGKSLVISERQVVLVLGGRFYALTLVAHDCCHVEFLDLVCMANDEPVC